MKPGGIFCLICALLFPCVRTHAQQWDWVQRFSSDSTGTAIGVDGNQNVYVAGTFTGTNYLGTNRFMSAGGNDVFLLKLNPDGEVVWAISTGGPLNDSIHRLVVATNGALFLVGNFTIAASLLADSVTNRSADVSNVFLARVDDGKFTWFDTLPPEAGGLGAIIGLPAFGFQSGVYGVGGIAFGPDESLWVIAASNLVFIRKYNQEGTILGGYAVDEPFFWPNGIAVSLDEHVFITGRLSNYTYFTAGLDAAGRIQWSWNAGSNGQFHEYNPIYAIACTPDSGVVTAAALSSGFKWTGTIVKHSAGGELLWQRNEYYYHKSVYSARALAVDPKGNIHVTGRAVVHYLYPSLSDGLWLFTVDANGNRVSESTISNRRYSFPWNLGTAIAVTSDGAVYITGNLTGSASFGTNEVSGGGAFVARRSTLQPEFVSEHVGDTVVFSWPRAAFPFALQRSDETGTNWFFVPQPPERVGVRWQVTLPSEQANGMFRLFRTNEAPIRYPLRIGWPIPPGGGFLNHQSAVILPPGTGTVTRTFSANVSADGPSGGITFDTLDADTGQLLSPTRSFVIDAYIQPYQYYITCFCGGVSSSGISFSPGEYHVALVVSDSVDHFTNSVRFEVISFDTALQELRSTLETLTYGNAGRHARALFESALRAEDRGRTKFAENRWRHFQRQLQRVTSLSEEDRGKLASAASQIQSLLQTK